MSNVPFAVPAPSGDAAARERIRHSLDEGLLVEASAGTGKTTELVARIVNVLAAGLTTVDHIVAVTFTNKAAGELKLRLRQGLDLARAGAQAESAAHLAHALAHLEEASIGTIHAFCAQILRERPVEARVDPVFEELAEPESELLFDRAFRGWMQERLNQPSPALRRALTRLAWPDNWETGSPIDQLKFAGRALLEWRDHDAPWQRRAFDRKTLVDQFADVILDQAPRLNTSRAFQPIRELAEWISRAEAVSPRDYDTLEARLVKLHRDIRSQRAKGIETIQKLLADFAEHSNANLAAALRDEMLELVSRFTLQKQQSGRLDFLDLLILTRDLVRGNAEVRRYLQRRFTHLFIDEFQDTDPLQAEILLLLSADNADEDDWRKVTPVPGKLFVVGDPKQSVYKFRRADVVLYQQLRDRLTERGVRLVRLTRSFRSVRPIQECVNESFAAVMRGDPDAGQIEYAALEPHSPPIDGQPSVVVLPVPEPYGARSVTKSALVQGQPDIVTGFVEWLLHESGWKVREVESGNELVPVSARHICILFRRRTNIGADITREYTRGLEDRGIPHLMAGSKSFHRREEVETMRVALSAVEWPGDELSVFATLRGSLFAIDDASLFHYRETTGRLSPFRVAESASDPITDALKLLAELHRQRNRRPIADTINRLLEATRAHSGFALRPGGSQTLANVYRLCDLARGFEMEGGISFRGFVEMLEQKAEKGESAEAPVLEEGTEGVRLMTVHAAKGLEFPVVILADMSAGLATLEPDRHIDGARQLCAHRILRCAPYELLEHQEREHARELAEGVRVAYVAATRARDLLVIPGVGDGPTEGWISPLNRGIYPPPGSWRRSQPAAGCPAFGEQSVLSRPPGFEFNDVESVRPGLHTFPTHNVVWWDPALLRRDVEPDYGVQQREMLTETTDQSLIRYRDWKTSRQSLLARGSTPLLTVSTPATTTQPPPARFPVSEIAIPRDPARPGGRRFGTLLHAVLRDLNFETPSIEELCQQNARLLGASGEELQAATRAAQALLNHEVMTAIRQATRIHREYPILWREETQVIEGIIDLALETPDGWLIIDFKTDAPPLPARYQTQVQWYAFALSRLTGGAPVRGLLIAL